MMPCSEKMCAFDLHRTSFVLIVCGSGLAVVDGAVSDASKSQISVEEKLHEVSNAILKSPCEQMLRLTRSDKCYFDSTISVFRRPHYALSCLIHSFCLLSHDSVFSEIPDKTTSNGR